MTKLARTTPRPAPVRTPQPRTKLVVVRRPARPAQAVHHDRTALRLAIGVIVTTGVVGVIWLLGYLGFRLGFSTLLGVPELSGTMGQGLLSGAMMVITLPQVIIKAGMAQPMWLMLLFVLMALPAGGLSAARPLPRGGPAVPQFVKVMSAMACGLAGVNALALVWWTASPIRQQLLGLLPADPAHADRELNVTRLQLEIVNELTD